MKKNLTMEFTNFDENVTSVVNAWEAGEVNDDGSTFMEEVKIYTEFKIANFISIFWYPILVPVGLIGNCLSFAVMMKPQNRKMSTCIYMAAISINDNLMMYVRIHEYLVSELQIHKWYSFECKFLAFVALFALQNCTFLILAMTIDKYIAIKWPHRAATYSTSARAKMISVILYASVFIYNVPHFFLSGVIRDTCIAYAMSNVMSRVYSWFSFVLNAVIPFTLLIHMNYVIVRTVRNSHEIFRANDKNARMEARENTMKNAEKQLTIMLLLVTTLFLILLCPTYFRFIYLVFAQRDTPSKYAKLMLIYQITSKLYSTNSGINFLLYCINGQKFRNDLKEILCCSASRSSSSKHKSQSNGTELSSI